MKTVAIILAAALAGLGSAFGLGIDVEGFGRTLSEKGWGRNRTASYTIDNQKYRTHVPTVTKNIDGGIFVSTRVDHLSTTRPDAVSYIELTFTPDGYVGASQIRIQMKGQRLNTGQVMRELPQIPLEGQIGSVDWRSAHMKLVLDLFGKLDTEFAKLEKGDEGEGGGDLWGRLTGSRLDSADLSAALRHNLNMLLSHVGHEFGVTGMK
ncbi:MAG: hypothetical protein AAGC74_12495 [Verrucomicrobiota bacterium]